MMTELDMEGIEARFQQLPEPKKEELRVLMQSKGIDALAFVLGFSAEQFRGLASQLRQPRRGLAAR
jgi:hypothetical protein